MPRPRLIITEHAAERFKRRGKARGLLTNDAALRNYAKRAKSAAGVTPDGGNVEVGYAGLTWQFKIENGGWTLLTVTT